MNLKVTYHAGERFLQRVFGLTSYTVKEVKKAMLFISRDIKDVECNCFSFPLPSFPSYRAIVKDGSLVTIVPKQ
ncbi:hypothetical protein MNB_SM-7-1193 [hydrothermal vent metagenome]|uniref:Uncharacterized protein n=1 Tax=hydrothermal vent metagenome TaxID=652676 RepID=A0A1W1BET4_9ZZZZ